MFNRRFTYRHVPHAFLLYLAPTLRRRFALSSMVRLDRHVFFEKERYRWVSSNSWIMLEHGHVPQAMQTEDPTPAGSSLVGSINQPTRRIWGINRWSIFVRIEIAPVQISLTASPGVSSIGRLENLRIRYLYMIARHEDEPYVYKLVSTTNNAVFWCLPYLDSDYSSRHQGLYLREVVSLIRQLYAVLIRLWL
jgi:hypothetical protein